MYIGRNQGLPSQPPAFILLNFYRQLTKEGLQPLNIPLCVSKIWINKTNHFHLGPGSDAGRDAEGLWWEGLVITLAISLRK